tara:strand:- start:3403 stop:3585 length:183 start_codon:yes stop_codon:yes gene_type:complete
MTKKTAATISEAFISTLLCTALAAGFFYCLTSTLTDMTKRDCHYGVLKACQQLEADGIKM